MNSCMRIVIRTVIIVLGVGSFVRAVVPIAAAAPQAGQSRVVDGAVHPEMIPDWRVYRILFRFLSNHSDRELEAIVAYLKQLHLGAGEQCPSCSVTPTREDVQIKNLIATAQRFYDRERDFDLALKKLLEQNPQLNEQVEFARLSKQKEDLCAEFVFSLGAALGLADAEKVRLHVQRMKRNIKLVR